MAKDLPPKIEVDKIIDLAPDQKAIYMQVLREVRATVMGEVERVGVAKSQLHILAGLTKLRQAACDPRLLGLPREFSHDDSGKLSALRELVDEVESGGHKVLIFSSSSALKLVREALTRTRSARVPRRQHDGSRRARRSFPRGPTSPRFDQPQSGGSGLTDAGHRISLDRGGTPPSKIKLRRATASAKRRSSPLSLCRPGTIEEKSASKAKKKDSGDVLSEDAAGPRRAPGRPQRLVRAQGSSPRRRKGGCQPGRLRTHVSGPGRRF